MSYFSSEVTDRFFANGMVYATKSDFADHPLGQMDFDQGDDDGLKITIKHLDHVVTGGPQSVPGMFSKADAKIEFVNIASIAGIAEGVIYTGWRAQHSGRGEGSSSYTYSAQRITINFAVNVEPYYLIEWVGNLPERLIFPGSSDVEQVETYTEKIAFGESSLILAGQSGKYGGAKSLWVRLEDAEFCLTNVAFKGNRSLGRIIYRGSPGQKIRDQIRSCLSFLLGLPLVCFGYTTYGPDSSMIQTCSEVAFTNRGLFLQLYPQPPYPICKNGWPVVDRIEFEKSLQHLYACCARLNFVDLSYQYWFAVCSPFWAASMHFGGLLENVQKTILGDVRENAQFTIVETSIWRKIVKDLKSKLKDAKLPPDKEFVIAGKLPSLNQMRAEQRLKRWMQTIGLIMGSSEEKAWSSRNSAAHGSYVGDTPKLVTNGKLLKLIFHRLVGTVTGCSQVYVDYSSLHHPTRLLTCPAEGTAGPDSPTQ